MGRPAFKPSDEQRLEVDRWVKGKVSIEEMARRLDLAPKTFRKHFAAELGLISVETVNTGLALAQPRSIGLRPTDEQRSSVLILAGARISHGEIARKLGISVEVLLEHFKPELDDGPAKCKGEGIEAMYYAMRGGNVAAAKVYLLFNAQGEQGGDQQPAREALVGKKEAASIAAKTAGAGTPWEALETSAKH